MGPPKLLLVDDEFSDPACAAVLAEAVLDVDDEAAEGVVARILNAGVGQQKVLAMM